MRVGRVAVVAAVGLSMVLAACGGDDDNAANSNSTAAPATTGSGGNAATTAAGGGGASGNCVVGVSWNNFQEPRWAKWDEPALKAAIEAGGGKYVSNDAKSSAATQATNVENLMSQGANVLVILAQDGTAIKPSVDAALAKGVPVIAYDRLIDDPKVLYTTFDNKGVGKLQAEAVLKVKPSGNFVIIKGNKADANADFLRSGYTEAGVPDVGKSNDKIKIVGETYTDNWATDKAQAEMEQFLTANSNKVDAVLSQNDGMALGVIAALKAQGLNGKVPVSGQDGDLANLNQVALGNQTVDVWKDARKLGKAAGESATQLCKDKDIAKVKGTAQFKSPGGNSLTAIQLTPEPITKDNLNVVLDAGWITKDVLCKDVPAGAAKACG